MNYDQITGILRAIVPAGLAWAVGKGYVPAGSVGDIGAAIAAIGAAVWSVYNNKTGKTIGR